MKKYLNQWIIGIVLIAILAVIVLLSVIGIPPSVTCPVTVCITDCPIESKMVPLFSSPSDKIARLKDPLFTRQLYTEAIAVELLLARPDTQVHMGFWSGKGNYGSMLRLLDAINEGAEASAVPPYHAIWEEGASAYDNYTSYTQLLDEH